MSPFSFYIFVAYLTFLACSADSILRLGSILTNPVILQFSLTRHSSDNVRSSQAQRMWEIMPFCKREILLWDWVLWVTRAFFIDRCCTSGSKHSGAGGSNPEGTYCPECKWTVTGHHCQGAGRHSECCSKVSCLAKCDCIYCQILCARA